MVGPSSLWNKCLIQLEEELTAQQFNTWIRPLQAAQERHVLRLFAPNRFVHDWVKERFAERIASLAKQNHNEPCAISIEGGSLGVAVVGARPVAAVARPGVGGP